MPTIMILLSSQIYGLNKGPVIALKYNMCEKILGNATRGKIVPVAINPDEPRLSVIVYPGLCHVVKSREIAEEVRLEPNLGFLVV